MRCVALLILWCFEVLAVAHDVPITLGALGAWTAFEPDLLIALVAANLDFRRNFEAPVRDRFGPPIVNLGDIHANLTTVGLWIGTTHAQRTVGISTAIEMMLGLNGFLPVAGLIGASTSSVSTPIASVAAAQGVPQISFSATSAALSNKASYPFFLRTLPPDNLQAKALWQWIEEFQVPRATAIYSTESYGEEMWESIRVLQQQAGKPDLLEGQPLQYMDAFDQQEATRVAREVKREGPRVLLLFLSQSMLKDFVNIMALEGMLGPSWQVICSDSCNSMARLNGVLPAGFMYFDFVGRGALYPKLEELWKELELDDIVGAEALARYHLDGMKAPLNNTLVEEVLRRTTSEGSSMISTYGAFAFDAYYAFLFAINALLHQGLSPSAIRGELLLHQLSQTNFTGVSGEVSFDENLDRMSSYELWNVQVASLSPRVVAEFALATGTFRFRADEDLTWMDGSRGRILPYGLTVCNPGTFFSNHTRQCVPCPVGRACQDGQMQPCPRGHYAQNQSSTSCSPCPPGSIAADIAASECRLCSPGFVANRSGLDSCERCPVGKYMNLRGGEQCFDCGQNQITESTGVQSESECRCEVGSFMCVAMGCIPCPAGLRCSGQGEPEQSEGYWTPTVDEPQCDFPVLRCRNKRECPGGAKGRCAMGREGLACNNCMANHYPYDGNCVPCGERDVLPTLLFFAGAAALMAVSSWSKVESLNWLTAAAVTSQVIMAVQALGSIRELALEWPYPVRRLIDLTRLLTFNFDIIRVGCIYGSDSPVLKFISQLLVLWLLFPHWLCEQPAAASRAAGHQHQPLWNVALRLFPVHHIAEFDAVSMCSES